MYKVPNLFFKDVKETWKRERFFYIEYKIVA